MSQNRYAWSLQRWLVYAFKSTVYSAGIIGTGYVLLQATFPVQNELAQVISLSRMTHDMEKTRALITFPQKLKEQRGYRDLSEDQAKADMIYRFVMENVNSDRPVWDVRA